MTPTTGEAPPPSTCASLRTETQTILQDNCGSCHGVQGKAGFSNVTDLESLVATGKVKPKDADSSYLLQRIVTGEMPPTPNAPVAVEQQAIIQQWIDECATPLGGASGDPLRPPECTPETPVTAEQWLDLIQADLVLLDPNDWEFQRYVSFIDLYNAGFCGTQIETYHQALVKLLNSLSQENDFGFPTAVADSHDTIFRIDLRDYTWDASLWDEIACANPYSVDYVVNKTLPVAKALQLATGAELFVQPGRSFMNIIARPPLYHQILDIPGTLAELALLKSNIPDLAKNVADQQNNLKEGLVQRAGFYDSGVSFSNRMIERQKVPGVKTGYFWHSFDFASNAGAADIFKKPLNFKADGGEVIFSLPNGLQAYMIVDADGNRLDKAPVEVVQDPANEDNAVENGISCMRCHASGILVKADEIRDFVETFPENFLSEEVLGVENLHPKENVVDIQKSDSNSFMGALEAAKVSYVIKTGNDQELEPIGLVVAAFEQLVDSARAAAEIGTSTEKLEAIQKLVPDLDKLIDPGLLSRDDFDKVFPLAVEALQIGDAQPIAACTPG